MKILLADDHVIVRRGLQMVLSLEPDMTIVGEASDGLEAVRLAAELSPNLVLMDIHMPGMRGSAATREIKRTCPTARVVILTGVESDEQVAEALAAGADGYLLKQVTPEELIHAIRVVASGEPYLQTAVTKGLVHSLRSLAQHPEKKDSHPTLTPRECEVLKLMATSATYREIAAKLVVSEETVRSHAKSVLAKLEQPNRTQAVIAALRQGLVELD